MTETATGSADDGTRVGIALVGTAAEDALDDTVVDNTLEGTEVGVALDDTEAGTLHGIEVLVGVTLDVVVAHEFLFLRWYVLHQDFIWVAERTSKPASFIAFITSFGSALIRLTACLL